MDWKLVPGNNMDFHRWSYGRVRQEADLYDPRTFGPADDMACGCGKYHGDTADDGTICESCGVRVSSNATLLRKVRLGHMNLLPLTRHPLGNERTLIDCFPVAPIAYRIDAAGQPTALGAKYDVLLKVTLSLESQLPERGSPDYYRSILELDRTPLLAALHAIVGPRPLIRGDGCVQVDDGTLFAELFHAIATLDRSVSALIRATGCTLKISGTI